MLQRLMKINQLLSTWLERVAIAGILVMMGVTCADVVGTKFFRSPVHGAIDAVMLSQVVAIAFTIALTQSLGKHVRVDFLVVRLRARTQAVIDSIVNFFLLVLFCVIVWRLYVFGHSLQVAREVSPTLYVPLYPFVYGVAFASISVCLVFLMEFLHSVMKAAKR
jgi:TRAP-type C4-dicarboxylate transport system permease small subunit